MRVAAMNGTKLYGNPSCLRALTCPRVLILVSGDPVEIRTLSVDHGV